MQIQGDGYVYGRRMEADGHMFDLGFGITITVTSERKVLLEILNFEESPYPKEDDITETATGRVFLNAVFSAEKEEAKQ